MNIYVYVSFLYTHIDSFPQIHVYTHTIPPPKKYRKDKPEIIEEIAYLQGVGLSEGIGEGVNHPRVHFLNHFDFGN